MEAVTKTLTEWRLESYAPKFDELGYDDLIWLQMMGAERLREVSQAVGMKTGHAAKFLTYMQQLASGVPPGSAPETGPRRLRRRAAVAALQHIRGRILSPSTRRGRRLSPARPSCRLSRRCR